MGFLYKFGQNPQFESVCLNVENREGRLIIELSGKGSSLLAPFIKNYFRWLNKMGPIDTREGQNIYSLYLPPVPGPVHAHHIKNFLQTWLFKHPTPQSVTMAVNYDCQCHCNHCSIPTVSYDRPLLTTEEIKSVIQECIELGVTNVTFTGGEPLLRDDLEACISSVPKEKAVTQVFTNGLNLDARRAASLKAAGLYAVMISLDSPDPEEHDRIRGRNGSFQAVEKAVKHCREAGILVGLSTYATNQSVQARSLPRLAGLAAKWNVHEITVLDIIPSGRLLKRDDILLTPKSRRMLLKEGRFIYKKFGGKPRMITQTWATTGYGFSKSIGCLAGSYQFHITAYGDFTPCDFTPLTFGNIRILPLSELWEKLTSHSAYHHQQHRCRMQTLAFREKYISPIPEGASLPFPIAEIH